MITNAGKAVLRGRLEAVASEFAGNFYMVLSTDSTATNLTDTTLPGEMTSLGLQRAVVTASHTVGQNNWTFTNSFVFSGTAPTAIYKLALFDAATGGNLIAEYLLSGPTTFSNSGDNAQFSCSFSL